MTDNQTQKSFILTLDCPDRPGIVHAVTGYIMSRLGNIIESQQFGQAAKNRFFLRVQFSVDAGHHREALAAEFGPIAGTFDMNWRLSASDEPTRTLILASRLGHCLNDLLYRCHSGWLPIDVVGVVSNHTNLEHLVAPWDIPFHHEPVTPETKESNAEALLSLVKELDVDLVVLARYMQILPTAICDRLPGRIINIHHSFLPSFKGARPYHQAHARGVKLVGGTAHYVTPDLDEGPIIEQDVVRVDHSHTPEALVAAGRDIEAHVLARAVKWHSERRVLLDHDHTVVFR